MVKPLIRGQLAPAFTPLYDDLSINYNIIPEYADYLISNGCKAVLVGGTTGEHMSLSVADRIRIIYEWLKIKRATGLYLLAQVGGAPLADVLTLTQYCAKNDVDGLMVLPELYFRPTTVTELVDYIGLVARAAPNLPVLYYHIPEYSLVNINMPEFVVAATAQIPNFKGLKYTDTDLSVCAQILRVLKEDQEIYLGEDVLIAPAAMLGIKSSICTTYNIFPKLIHSIVDAVDRGDVGKARALQEKLSLIVDAHAEEGPWVPTFKVVMELVTGIKFGPPSLPERPISLEARKRIKSKL